MEPTDNWLNVYMDFKYLIKDPIKSPVRIHMLNMSFIYSVVNFPLNKELSHLVQVNNIQTKLKLCTHLYFNIQSNAVYFFNNYQVHTLQHQCLFGGMHTYVSHGGNMRWKRDRPTCCNNISKCCKLSACPIALLFSRLVRFIGNKNRNNNLFIRYERAKREEKKCTHQKKRHTHSSGHSYYTENRT